MSCAVVGSGARKPKAGTHCDNLVEARLKQRRCAVGRRLVTSCNRSHRCAQRRRWNSAARAERLSAPMRCMKRVPQLPAARTRSAPTRAGARTWLPPRAGLLGRLLDSDLTGTMQFRGAATQARTLTLPGGGAVCGRRHRPRGGSPARELALEDGSAFGFALCPSARSRAATALPARASSGGAFEQRQYTADVLQARVTAAASLLFRSGQLGLQRCY